MNSMALDYKPVSSVKNWEREVDWGRWYQLRDMLFIKKKSGETLMFIRKVFNPYISRCEFMYTPCEGDEYCVIPKSHQIFGQ